MRHTSGKNLGAWNTVRGAADINCAGARWKRSRTGFTLIELAVVVVLIGILAALAIPNYVKIKEKAKEAESKAALHNIQIALERFGVDNDGNYPQYLIGGENKASGRINTMDSQVSRTVTEVPVKACSDNLIRNSYLTSYPKNPFVRNGRQVEKFQQRIGDPLRNTMRDGHLMGTRFGPYGKTMGQVLCESRWLEWTYYSGDTGEPIQWDTWANIQYPFYDVWMGELQKPYLAGSFMYKSMGEVIPSPGPPNDRETVNIDDADIVYPASAKFEAVLPVDQRSYILGVWGGYRSKGMDVLGEEPLLLFSFLNERKAKYNQWQFVFNSNNGMYELPPVFEQSEMNLLGIPPWTRGVTRTHIGPLWGSPYGPSMDGTQQLSTSNPNGMKDAIILLLTAE